MPFLRVFPAETLVLAPALIPEKRFRKPCYGQVLDRPFALASFRMCAGDPAACNNSCRLVMVLPALILGRHSAGPEQVRPSAALVDVVKAPEEDCEVNPWVAKLSALFNAHAKAASPKQSGFCGEGGAFAWNKRATAWPLQFY